jgi:carboxyl-terminal processing protease
MMPAMLERSERSERYQAPQVPVWFLLAMMAMMGLTAAGFLFLGTRLAPGAAMPSEEMKLMDLVYAKIQEDYVNALDGEENEDLVHKAIAGLVSGLDRYSEYIPPAKVTRFDEANSGVYSGVGFVMQPKGGNITVYFPFPGGPAEGAGLRVGDQIVAITTLEKHDGEWVGIKTTKVEDLVDQSIQDPDRRERSLTTKAANLIKGKVKTPVRLLVKRGDRKPFSLTITRDKVPTPSIKWARLLDAEAGIGYIHLAGFVRHSASEFDTALANLTKAAQKADGQLRGLILDLRFNPGGVLDTCLELTNRFLKEGVIVTLNKGENNENGRKVGEHVAVPEKCTVPDLPLVILINGSSASASEVMSGALQDYGRAVVVGARSFGKGLVQSIYTLSPEARLKITTSEYRTPKGRNIQRKGPKDETSGIHPDRKVTLTRKQRSAIHGALLQREVPEKYRAEAEALAKRLGLTIEEPLSPQEDPQLAAALEEVRKLVAERDR